MSLFVTTHAVARYIQRAKPQLGEEQARRELEALIQFATPVERPEFTRGCETADSWIELAPEVVGVVRGRTITTILTPDLGEAAQRERRRKNRLKQHRRAARKTRNASSLNRRSGRPEVREEPWPT